MLRNTKRSNHRYGLAPFNVNIFTPPRKWPADPTKRRGGPQSPAVDLKEKRGNRNSCEKRKRVQGGGYCECCGVHYSDLKVHCESKKHREFVADEGNYQELDAFCASFREQSRKEGRGIYRYVLRDGIGGKEDEVVKNEVKKKKNKRRRSLLERLSGDPKSRYMPKEVGVGRSRRSRSSR